MNIRRERGLDGERMAAEYLCQIGYSILHLNWRFKRLEIDIVARDKDSLVFVEVKTRSSLNFGHPEDFVNDQKISAMMQAAEAYLATIESYTELRFDIISIHFDPSDHSHLLKHFKDAFYE